MKKIVIIDDEPDIGYILSYELTNLGYLPRAFQFPEEAVEHVKNNHVDAIICDFQMPKMDGLQVFMNLQQFGYKSPFFILTGEPVMDTPTILKQGVTDVLFKPQDLIKIKSVLKHHLG
jgi:DNA-binding NtrC family response regulator